MIQDLLIELTPRWEGRFRGTRQGEIFVGVQAHPALIPAVTQSPNGGDADVEQTFSAEYLFPQVVHVLAGAAHGFGVADAPGGQIHGALEFGQ